MNIKRRKLVEDNIELAHSVVNRVFGRSNIPSHVREDDLRAWGYHGLLDAAIKFDFNRGIKFSTYATRRVEGAIYDGMREADPISRQMRSKIKAGVMPRIEHIPLDEPTAKGCTLEDALVCDGVSAERAQSLEDSARFALSRIPASLRVVVNMYFFKRLSMSEIGDKLRVSESRASQILKSAILEMRSHLCPHRSKQPISLGGNNRRARR